MNSGGKNKQAALANTGFTIIELMIATTILSVILVLVSAMAIKIGSLYTKGVNQSKIQDNVRTAMDEITQHLQLMGGSTAYQQAPTPTSAGALCIDSTRYTYVLDKQIGTNSPHVLWRDTLSTPATSNTTCTPATLTNNDPSSGTGGTNGQELASPNSRLTAFCIGDYVNNTCSVPSTTTSPFSITIGMAYGGTDLTSNKGISTTCDKNIGDHYCATAYLSTIVDQRVGSVGVGSPPPSNGNTCEPRPSGLAGPTYDFGGAHSEGAGFWFAPSVAGSGDSYPFYTTSDQKPPANTAGDHGPIPMHTPDSVQPGRGFSITIPAPKICTDKSVSFPYKGDKNNTCYFSAIAYPDFNGAPAYGDFVWAGANGQNDGAYHHADDRCYSDSAAIPGTVSVTFGGPYSSTPGSPSAASHSTVWDVFILAGLSFDASGGMETNSEIYGNGNWNPAPGSVGYGPRGYGSGVIKDYPTDFFMNYVQYKLPQPVVP